MSYIREYLGKSVQDLQNELLRLVNQCNQEENTFLIIYATAFKGIPEASVIQDDYYIIHDLLDDVSNVPRIDMYLETPGGSGVAAEEIIKLLHRKASSIYFTISGEAKSAGTILAMSGNEIMMTETGSLGPIDAQINMGRMTFSAYDYIEWLKERYEKASAGEPLNPVDSTIIAQINPGELRQIENSLEFAKDIVKKCLQDHKFRDWNETEDHRTPVTATLKQSKASEIADSLVNHTKWRTHGRSLKIEELTELGLKITKIENNPNLKEIVYRIQAVCRNLFESSNIYKIFVTSNNIVSKAAMKGTQGSLPVINNAQPSDAEFVQISAQCAACGKTYNFFAKFVQNINTEKSLLSQGFIKMPEDSKFVCDCGTEIDLLGIKNEIERQTKKKIIYKA